MIPSTKAYRLSLVTNKHTRTKKTSNLNMKTCDFCNLLHKKRLQSSNENSIVKVNINSRSFGKDKSIMIKSTHTTCWSSWILHLTGLCRNLIKSTCLFDIITSLSWHWLLHSTCVVHFQSTNHNLEQKNRTPKPCPEPKAQDNIPTQGFKKRSTTTIVVATQHQICISLQPHWGCIDHIWPQFSAISRTPYLTPNFLHWPYLTPIFCNIMEKQFNHEKLLW
jgi:hypothetical protein